MVEMKICMKASSKPNEEPGQNIKIRVETNYIQPR
jgi:hypothetical protein